MGTLENPVGTVLSPPYDAQPLIHCCNKDPKGINLLSLSFCLCYSYIKVTWIHSTENTRVQPTK